MDIAIISCANTRCGIGRYSAELSSKYDSLDHNVTLYRKETGEEDYVVRYHHRSLKFLRHYVAPYYLKKAYDANNFDVVHADYVDAASSYPSGTKTPLVSTVHDAIPFIYPASGFAQYWYKRQLRLTAEKAYKLIVVSNKSKQDLIKFTDIKPDQIAAIHNGINHDFFYPDEKKADNDLFTIRYIGGLGGPYKNVKLLLETAEQLKKKKIDYRMEIGGGFPEHTELPELAESLNLKNVSFTGFIPDEELRSFLAGADLFLYPSLYEGFGFPPLEAMACGTAAVAAKRGSLPEVLKGGAILAEPTAEEFCEQVLRIKNNSDLQRELEEKAVAVSGKYTWDRCASETLALYEEALNKKSAKPIVE